MTGAKSKNFVGGALGSYVDMLEITIATGEVETSPSSYTFVASYTVVSIYLLLAYRD